MPRALQHSGNGSNAIAIEIRSLRTPSRARASDTFDIFASPKSRRVPFFCTPQIQFLPPRAARLEKAISIADATGPRAAFTAVADGSPCTKPPHSVPQIQSDAGRMPRMGMDPNHL